jgi:transposase
MKAYSIDLRQKIIDAYHSRPLSQRQVAEQFSVALSFVQKLLKQYRLTGNIAPKAHGGGGQLKLTPEQLAILAQLIETQNDATLEELCDLLTQKTGVVVSRATMGRMTQRLNMTVKKKNTIPVRKSNRKSATSQN